MMVIAPLPRQLQRFDSILSRVDHDFQVSDESEGDLAIDRLVLHEQEATIGIGDDRVGRPH